MRQGEIAYIQNPRRHARNAGSCEEAFYGLSSALADLPLSRRAGQQGLERLHGFAEFIPIALLHRKRPFVPTLSPPG